MQENNMAPACDDLELLAATVTKRLRSEHGIETPPDFYDYSVALSDRQSGPREDVLVRIEIDSGVSVTIKVCGWQGEGGDLDDLLTTAKEISDGVASVLRDASDLVDMYAEVEAAARREVAKYGDLGLKAEVVTLEFAAFEGSLNASPINLEITALGANLQKTSFLFEVESAEEVAEIFSGMLDEQAARSARLTDLQAMEATGTIDAVLLAALVDAGFDLAALLSNLSKAEQPINDVTAPDGQAFCLRWENGTLLGEVLLEEGVQWHAGKLSFDRAPSGLTAAGASSLNVFYNHRFLDDRLIVKAVKEGRDGSGYALCDPLLTAFNADTGRLWLA
ncbi:hypothetical protein [Sphingomonas sp. 22176]|uniref:hypothetical protein n=1 Tax=Sphingomonas sp. 22176 TaxID=3453884 RepID=UPI003F8390E9